MLTINELSRLLVKLGKKKQQIKAKERRRKEVMQIRVKLKKIKKLMCNK